MTLEIKRLLALFVQMSWPEESMFQKSILLSTMMCHLFLSTAGKTQILQTSCTELEEQVDLEQMEFLYLFRAMRHMKVS